MITPELVNVTRIPALLRFRSCMSPSMAVWRIVLVFSLIKLLLADGLQIDISGVNGAELINEKKIGSRTRLGQLPLH